MDKEDYVFGIRATIEAIKADKQINKILVQKGLNNDLYKELLPLLRPFQKIIQSVPGEKLNRVTRKNHQGVICFISPVHYFKLEDILPGIYEQGKVPAILILDRVTDVRNFGAIARTAECNGFDAIVIPRKGSAQITADAIKTSAGALHKIPVCREPYLDRVIEYLQDYGVKVVACSEKTENHTFDVDMTGPTAIIMGSEENGVTSDYLKRADAIARIPMTGTIESLNVSVACGIISYELIRQRIKE